MSGRMKGGGKEKGADGGLVGWLERYQGLAMLLAVVALLRIPSLFEPYWYGDEGIYLTLGKAWRQGWLLYREIHDNKPPLIYWLAGLAGDVFWLRFVLLWWHLATVVMFYKLMGVWFSRRRAVGWWATVVFSLLTSLPFWEGQIANGEIFMIGPVVAGMWVGLSGGKKISSLRAAVAGGLFSMAFLFKAPAALDAAALAIFWLFGLGKWGGKEIRAWLARSGWMFLGWVVPVMGMTGWFWLRGAGGDYLQAILMENLGYLVSWGGPSLSGSSRGLIAVVTSGLALRGGLMLVGLAILARWRKALSREMLLAMVWFLLSLFGALLSGRPYPHYLLQVAPALAVLVVVVVGSQQMKERIWAGWGLGLLLLAGVGVGFWSYRVVGYYGNWLGWALGAKEQVEYWSWFDKRVPRTYQAARYLVSHTLPGEKIFIWGDEPGIYALSGRLPASKYTVAYHVADLKMEERVRSDLELELPAYILKVRGEKRAFPGLDLLIDRNYVLAEVIEDVYFYRYSPVVSRTSGVLYNLR